MVLCSGQILAAASFLEKNQNFCFNHQILTNYDKGYMLQFIHQIPYGQSNGFQTQGTAERMIHNEENL